LRALSWDEDKVVTRGVSPADLVEPRYCVAEGIKKRMRLHQLLRLDLDKHVGPAAADCLPSPFKHLKPMPFNVHFDKADILKSMAIERF